MKATGENFTVRYGGLIVPISTYRSKGMEVFHVKMPGMEPFILTQTINSTTGNEIWMPVPSGDLNIANDIGKLIEVHKNPAKLF